MTDPVTTARHWLLTYGADRMRWPQPGRAEVEAAIADSADLTALRAEMAALDAALADWAHTSSGDPAAVARIVEHAEQLAAPARASYSLPFWLAGGAVAASIAAALMLARTDPAPVAPAPPAATIAGDDSGAEAFRLLFTPTIDEDMLI